jgi:hypothetical protein
VVAGPAAGQVAGEAVSTSPDMQAPAGPVSAEVARLVDHDTDPDELAQVKTLITGVADAAGAKALAGAAVASSQSAGERVAVLEHRQGAIESLVDVKLDRFEKALLGLSEKVGAFTESGKFERLLRISAYAAVIVGGGLVGIVAALQLLDRYHGGTG